MSHYTASFRKIIDSGVNIFDYDYPLHNPAYKPTLEKKIIDHYYYADDKEICCETVGLFIGKLRVKLNEIMPKYNIMYKSLSDKIIDPLTTKTSETSTTSTSVNDVDKLDTQVLDKDMVDTTTVDKDATVLTILDGETTNDVTTAVDSVSSDVIANSQKFSDTPQGRTDLDNTDYLTEITEEDNAVDTTLDSDSITNATGTQDTTTTVTNAEDTSTSQVGTEDTTTTLTATEDSTLTVNETVTMSESDRSQAEMLEVFRKEYHDIDLMIINDLGDLFMLLY